jgi:hypothetical protein
MEISTTETLIMEIKGNEHKRTRTEQKTFQYLIIWDTGQSSVLLRRVGRSPDDGSSKHL